jgi:hypothetical protein
MPSRPGPRGLVTVTIKPPPPGQGCNLVRVWKIEKQKKRRMGKYSEFMENARNNARE